MAEGTIQHEPQMLGNTLHMRSKEEDAEGQDILIHVGSLNDDKPFSEDIQFNAHN